MESNQDKELLLRDLCARLPYRIIVEYGRTYEGKDLGERKDFLTGRMLDSWYNRCTIGFTEVYSITPYLRPMGSMTEAEDKEFCDLLGELCVSTGYFPHYDDAVAVTFWLIKHHFDYRGLIEKGLAIEAPKDMYN